MVMADWMGMGGFVIVNAGFYIGLIKYINHQDGKIYEKIDMKVTRAYQRLDENKDKVEATYLRKDMCDAMHKNTADNLMGLEARMTTSIEKLDKKVEDNMKTIINLLTKQ